MKAEMTISKKFTLNTQNYSSVSPGLIIKIESLNDPKELIEAHGYLHDITDGLFQSQIENDAKTMAIIKKLGFAEYFRQIDKKKIEEVITESVKKLSNLPPF